MTDDPERARLATAFVDAVRAAEEGERERD